MDTIGTLAHVIQRRFDLRNAKALYLSTACSSFVDALELATAYCETRRASKALIVAAEHNSAYARDEDITSGHLWGDGAAAVTVGVDGARAEFKVLDVTSHGLAHQGHGPDAISLSTRTRALTMPHGREVFERACEEMANAVRGVLTANELSLGDVALIVPHQANKRIIHHVAKQLGLPPDRMGFTIGSLGTRAVPALPSRCIGTRRRHGRGARVVLVTFGGGYSVGAALLQRVGGFG
ncbi:MAG: 3-oxoacyl-[acyl-carrier-protein] synthase III C-terminal domain-containing protein [Steroidobacteraceae bacterium]